MSVLFKRKLIDCNQSVGANYVLTVVEGVVLIVVVVEGVVLIVVVVL
jgi:hypothetical protein